MEEDWICRNPDCSHRNFAGQTVCNICKKAKNLGMYVDLLLENDKNSEVGETLLVKVQQAEQEKLLSVSQLEKQEGGPNNMSIGTTDEEEDSSSYPTVESEETADDVNAEKTITRKMKRQMRLVRMLEKKKNDEKRKRELAKIEMKALQKAQREERMRLEVAAKKTAKRNQLIAEAIFLQLVQELVAELVSTAIEEEIFQDSHRFV